MGIFRSKMGQLGISVCWYYRPEQVSGRTWIGERSIHTCSCRHSTRSFANSGKAKSSRLVRNLSVLRLIDPPQQCSITIVGHFADHAIEDIIEKIAVQFTARHLRGRPRPPYWYIGWPLYVCDSRYHDKEPQRSFVK